MDRDYVTQESASSSAVLTSLAEIEAAAEDVLSDRAQIVELDKKRQENRLAARNLKSTDAKTWMCLGSTFVKLPTKKAQSFLESNQKIIDEEINRLRDGLKDKVNKLHDLEGKSPVNRGYFLVPLSREDARSGASKPDDWQIKS